MKEPITRRRFIKRSALYGLGALVCGYPFFIERYTFQTNTYKIPVPNLPKTFNGFTMVQLTDLHYGFLMPLAAIRYIIEKANSLRKDVIVCTGDYIHGPDGSKGIDSVWRELIRLKARHGVYSVLGNHDHWGDASRSLNWLAKSGQNLRHKVVPITRGKERIWLGGSGDYWEDELGIDKAFDNVPPKECKILLSHNPDGADTPFRTRIDLIVSGHTHGGQVSIPLWGPPILPVENKLYSSGFIMTKKTRLYISRGLGWALIPVRFNCYPEISVLKLVRESMTQT
jgi:predicted MPP superfamily phosphohydrolase